MRRIRGIVLVLGVLAVVPWATTKAQEGKEAKAGEVKGAPSKIVNVTIYQNTALITREVTVPDAMGLQEVVVTPLPPSTMETSLYAEGSDGVRIMSARYKTRAINQDNRLEVQQLQTKLRENAKKTESLTADLKALEANTGFLTKIEGFTAATLVTLTDKGHLDAEKTISLANFVRETRAKAAKEEVTIKQQIQAIQEDTNFTQRRLAEVSGGFSRIERDAIINVEKTKAGAATIRLNYLVSNVSWRPQYKLRAGTKDKDPVVVEYLASMQQQTGEDWGSVNIVLSTAQPRLNAAPPDLQALEIGIGSALAPGGGRAAAGGPPGTQTLAIPQQGGMNNVQFNTNPGQGGFGGGFGGGQGGFGGAPDYKVLEAQSRDNREKAQNSLNQKDVSNGNRFANEAAAIDQYRDLLVTKEDLGKLSPFANVDGPSVTYHLKSKLTLPSRNDEQLFEIAKLDLAPKFYYKAVPLITPNVYRIADLTNTTDMILLPGEATMYLGTDFVGQTRMPLVAIGKLFTVGFGADPQLSVSRKLMDKSRTVQGGNQVLNFKYRILVNSYKATPVDVQVWDRLPFAEAQQQIAITLSKGETELSKDALYVRDERPKNLLRWDIKIDTKQNSEKAMAIDYDYSMSFDKNVNVAAISAASK
ncbi:MAG: mucoidy inhibitor MuiA family protein [Fimbriiglobus sp.]